MAISKNSDRIAKNAFFMYIRMFLMMLITLYTSRVTLNCLGISDYGIYNIVGGVVTMFSFINSSMAGSIQKFLNIAIEKKDNSVFKVFTSSIHIHLLIAITVLILAETVGLWFLNNKIQLDSSRIIAANYVYQCSVLSSLIMIVSVPYNALIIAEEKMSAFAYISIAEASLKLLVVFILLYLNKYDRLIIYGFLILAVQITIRFMYQYYCYRNFAMPSFIWNFDWKLINRIGSFAMWSFIGNLAIIGLTQGVNIVLNLFFGPVVNAARGLAVQLQNAVQGFAGNFQIAINPQIVKSYVSGNKSYMYKLITTSSKFSFYVLMILIIPIAIEIDIILKLWLNEVPNHTGNFVRLILAISLFESCANSLTTGINANGNIKKYQLVIGGVLLLVVPISYGLLKIGFPAEIVFLVHLIITCIAQFFRLLFAKYLIGISIKRYFTDVYIRVGVVFVISSTVPLVFYYLLPSSFMRLVTVSLVSILSSCTIVYFFGMNKSEKIMVKDKIVNLINKIR